MPGLLQAARIPERYRNCRLENFTTEVRGSEEQLLRARTAARRYIDEFVDAEGRFCESGLLFIGPSGVGKTHLATAILVELIRRWRVRGRFADFTTLLHRIQTTFSRDSAESKQQVLEPVVEAEVLVLDELGAQKPSAWVTEMLYLILNTRYNRRLPTLFTTNYRLSQGERRLQSLDLGAGCESFDLLSLRIPAALVSRLFEMAQPVVIESVDFREKYKMVRTHL